MDLFVIENAEQDIQSTNYWQTEHAARGFFYISINAGAIRLLVPDVQIHAILEMTTAREVVVSRGPWPDQGKHDGIELLFEDDSDNPYCLHLMSEQCDRLPGNKDQKKKWVFAAWTSAGKQFEKPCFCRMVKHIPYMKPYTK